MRNFANISPSPIMMTTPSATASATITTTPTYTLTKKSLNNRNVTLNAQLKLTPTIITSTSSPSTSSTTTTSSSVTATKLLLRNENGLRKYKTIESSSPPAITAVPSLSTQLMSTTDEPKTAARSKTILTNNNKMKTKNKREHKNKSSSSSVSELIMSKPNSIASVEDYYDDDVYIDDENVDDRVDEEEEDDDDEDEDDDDDNTGYSESCLTTSSDDDDEIKPGLETISEEHSIRKRKDKLIDDSTCCDKDFTWVRSEPPVELSQSQQNNNNNNNNNNSNNHHHHHSSNRHSPSHHPPTSQSTITTTTFTNTSGKPPPRPSGSSLDRRRNNTSTNRQERDSKSRSTHSLKEKSQTNEFKDVSKGHHHPHDNGSYHHPDNNNTSGGFHLHRGSPKFWDIPPPPSVPYTQQWDQHYWNIQRSREELRMLEYRRQQEMYRYGSNGTLSNSQIDLYGGGVGGIGGGGGGSIGGCCSRYAQPPPPMCCSCDHNRPMLGNNLNQRQDTDERLRRLQSDKESLTLQVQVLSEQVSAQSERINDLETKLTEKTQLMNNIEDLLHREMLSRSSLETQKLELLSAMSDLKLKQAALERENLDIRSSHMNNNNNNNINNNSIMTRRPPLGPARLLTSTTLSTSTSSSSSPLNSTPMHGSHGSLQQSGQSPITPKTPPTTSRRQVDLHYSSLPRQSFPTSVLSSLITTTPLSTTSSSSTASSTPSPLVGQNNSNNITLSPTLVDTNANPKQQRMVAFAETEKVIEDSTDLPRSYTPQPTPSPLLGQKNKGFRSIFGKLKRSNSGNLEELPMDSNGEFKRGGIRSTAGPRLGWSQNQQKPDTPFIEWDIESICLWLDEIGLDAYENEARRWLKNGAAELVSASPVDIEKELNLKSPLHRKKILLALTDMTGNDNDELFRNAGKLDMTWISKWLEDIGLPQYKDVFLLGRIDGRMLHKLTMDDLNVLHVTSMLHVASLRRAIQIMRENNWEPDCLIRRSSGDDNEKVSLWTAHRVMEWLEVIDLAEYTPNLRGAGVHGALMVYEPKFTSQLLAEMLSIPPNKTLLRRHLALHFSELIGRDIIQAKRDAENTLGYIPLTITSKIKTPKKSQFSLKRKKSTKGGDEWSDYVCPMGSSGDHLLTTSNQNSITTTNTTTVSMMNPITQEIVAGSGVASQQNSESPTSTRSSNSTS